MRTPSLVFFWLALLSTTSPPGRIRSKLQILTNYTVVPWLTRSPNPCPPALCRFLPPPRRATPKRCTILVVSGTRVGKAEPTVIWAGFRRLQPSGLSQNGSSHHHYHTRTLSIPTSDHGPCLSTPRSFTACTPASFLFFPFPPFRQGPDQGPDRGEGSARLRCGLRQGRVSSLLTFAFFALFSFLTAAASVTDDGWRVTTLTLMSLSNMPSPVHVPISRTWPIMAASDLLLRRFITALSLPCWDEFS